VSPLARNIVSGVSEREQAEAAVDELICCFGEITPEAVLFFVSSHHDIAKIGTAISKVLPLHSFLTFLNLT
jgi:hypothetical protein